MKKKSSNSDIVGRLKEYFEYKKLNSSSFAKKLGYDNPEKISRLFRLSNAKPSFDIIYDIANMFGDINIDWLITGKGEMLKKGEEATPPESNKQANKDPPENEKTELYKEVLKAKEEQINVLNKYLADKEEQIKELRADITMLKSQLDKVKQELQQV